MNNKQLIEVLKLLSVEGDAYATKEKRINIYGYRWQFVIFHEIRRGIIRIISIIRNKGFQELNEGKVNNGKKVNMACYCLSNNLIEIYEFNIRTWCKKNNISEKEYMIKVLLHEYRHKYQFNTNMILGDEEEEVDANRFAEDFYNENRSRI